MNLFAIAGLCCSITGFMLAIFACLAGKQKFYNLIVLFHIAVGFWGFGAFLAGTASDPTAALIGWRISFTGGYFIAPIFLNLVIALRPCFGNRFVILTYVQAMFFALVTWIQPTLLFGESRFIFGIHFFTSTLLFNTAVFAYLLIVLTSYLLLFRLLRSEKGLNKWQVKCVAIGFSFGFLGGSMTLLPFFNMDFFYPAGNFGTFVSGAVVTYMVLWKKVFDLRQFAEIARRDKLAAMSTVAASMNHEIRNPLFIIKGTAEMLMTNLREHRTGDIDDERAKTLAKITDQATRAMDIMKRFSTFAKQTTDQSIREQPVALPAILENVVTLIGAELSLDQITLSRKIPAGLPSLLGDARYFEEIFFNLFMNACQAIKAGNGPGKIEVEAEQNDNRVRIAIRDNGPGIPEQDLKRIFEPFHTTKQDGTGLGLYIAKLLAERNGGKIGVASKVGEGTTFTLTFRATAVSGSSK